MEKSKPWFIIVIGMVLCLALQACGPQGPAAYGMNYVWKVNDSSFSITDAQWVDGFSSDQGETVTPSAGHKLLVIYCDAHFSGEDRMESMRLTVNGEGTFNANWPGGPYERGGKTVYTFSVPQNLLSEETLHQCRLDVTLRVEGKTRSETFVLWKTS